MTNYRGVKFAEETCQLTAESKNSTVGLKLFFIPCFRGKNILTPALVGLELFLGDLDQKKTSAGMKQKAKQDRAKSP